ncbi:MAG: nuclease-related domain-containing protein [Pseudomonadota bacterium]
MDWFSSITLANGFYVGVGAGLVLAAAVMIGWRVRSNPSQQLKRLIKKHSKECMSDIVVPDGLDGEIQLDYLLLTPRGLLVLDIKHVNGRLYGGDNMDAWTVIQGGQRFTFANPAGPLRERVIAVQSLLQDVPVQGRVVVLGDVKFATGVPDCVVSLPRLQEEFAGHSALGKATLSAFYPSWHRMQEIATPASV